MTIIVFLIDTSASMNQRAYLGGRPTLLDVAKGAVETFVKVRQRSLESRGDRYMLLTFEEPPANIKAGWKENLATFMNELKNLQSTGMTMMGAALKHTFDVLNINRMQTGIDTYGQGRCPFYLEPSVIVVITDGGKLSNSVGVQEDFNLPMHSPIPGSELTREPFRWDQRLFSLVLRLSGTPAVERDTGLVPSDNSPIDAMCEVTGGRSYCITSHRMMMQCIDSLVQKVQSGVVINFEKIGPDPPPIGSEGSKDFFDDGEGEHSSDRDWDVIPVSDNNNADGGKMSCNSALNSALSASVNANNIGGSNQNGNNPKSILSTQLSVTSSLGNSWHSCRKLIYVQRSAQKGFAVGFWPIPESFWPELSASSLPPRSAHPNVKFTCTSQEPMVIETLPFDKYELEPSPLTQYILLRKQPTVCWQVFVANSAKNSEVGHPFGYLKASTNLTCVNLFVMPYNYPVLLPLLDELFKVHRSKPTNEWRTQFNNYLKTMPSYYAGPLRRALVRMGSQALASNLVPDGTDNSLSYSVLNYLKRLKNQARHEFDKLCSEVAKNRGAFVPTGASGAAAGVPGGPEGIRLVSRSPLKKELISHPLLLDKFSNLRDQLNDFNGFVIGVRGGVGSTGWRRGQSYRNPFDIPRRLLLDQVARMRANFLQTSLLHTRLVDEDQMHSMPVGQMGNYQEYLKRMPPQLREIESTPVRQHMFGNPFKIDKRMMVDEADIDLVGGGGVSSGRGVKRSADSPSGSSRPNKRKPGPIPKHVVVRRPRLRPPTPSVPPLLSPTSPTLPSQPLPVPVVENQVESPTPMPGAAAPFCPVEGLFPPPAPDPISRIVLVNGSIDDQFQSGPRSPSPPEILNNNTDSVTSHHHHPQANAPIPPPSGLMFLANHAAAASEQEAAAEDATKLIPSHAPVNPTNHVTRCLSPPPVLQICADSQIPDLGANSRLNQLPPVLNHMSEGEGEQCALDPAEIRRHNLQVRRQAYKEVRRPGKNFTLLFGHLKTIQGALEVRVSLLREVIQESLRFKRRNLAALLEEFLQGMVAASTAPENIGGSNSYGFSGVPASQPKNHHPNSYQGRALPMPTYGASGVKALGPDGKTPLPNVPRTER
ncbi:integrator complex subunit 6 [Ischnura elegans]|uniref:integrator complex subunit 6 n=1 Tax=Ischnura elegans TaxID=197161 RepID=UPI001ED86E68|nr:integrator complex subunit 6 [Ischnura elegans]